MRIFFDVDTQYDFMDKDGALYVPGAEEIKPNIKSLTDYIREKHFPLLGSIDAHYGTLEYKERETELQRWGGPFPDHCMYLKHGKAKIIESCLIYDYRNEGDYGLYVPNPLLMPCTIEEVYKLISKLCRTPYFDCSPIPLDEYIAMETFVVHNRRHTGIDENYLIGAMDDLKKTGASDLQCGVYFEKQSYDVFTNPNLDELLKRVKIDEAVVYGVATDYCVKAAVLGLQKRGVQCYVVEDAIAGVTPDTTKSALEEMLDAGAKLVTTKNVLEARI